MSKLLSSSPTRPTHLKSTHLQLPRCSIYTTAYFSTGKEKKVPKLNRVPFAHSHSVPRKEINPPPHTWTLMETHGQPVLIFFQHADICLTKWPSNFRHRIPREVLKMDTSPRVLFIACVHVHVCRVGILVAKTVLLLVLSCSMREGKKNKTVLSSWSSAGRRLSPSVIWPCWFCCLSEGSSLFPF